MKTIRLVAAASIAAAITLLSSGAAQAYPDAPNVTISIPDDTLVGGNVFTFTAKADVDCDWTITYAKAEGQSPTQTGSGKSLSGSYDTPVVSSTERSPLVASCKYDDGVPATTAVSPARLQTASASAVVTLLPRGSGDDDKGDDNSVLPDTGGSNLWIFVLGGALVVVGGGTLYASRRRNAGR